MEKLNRNNADIEKLRDKKVAVRLVGKDAEIDFRKWLEENGIHFNNEELLIRNWLRTEICYCVEGNSWDCGHKNWFTEKDYILYEWEIVDEEKKEILKSCLPQKTYTIKDVVENEGKIYRTTTSDCIYKYYKSDLYYKFTCIPTEPWKKTVLTLGEILKLKFIEYKPEPKKITFEEALKEMEQGKVCRSLYSGTEYLLSNNHFEKLNRNYTTLSYKEIKEEWVVVE